MVSSSYSSLAAANTDEKGRRQVCHKKQHRNTIAKAEGEGERETVEIALFTSCCVILIG